jgi:hypothetical protein
MRRNVVFLALSLLVLILFACDFTLPKAIEIKGTPSVRFSQSYDIGSQFTELINDAIKSDDAEGMDIVSCANTEFVTFVIHMDLFDRQLTIDEDAPDGIEDEFPGIDLNLIHELVDNDEYTLTEDKDLLNSGKDSKGPMTLPLSSIGSYLTDFKFKGLITKLFFSGATIIPKLRIEIATVEIDENHTGPIPEPDDELFIKFEGVENLSSGYDNWKTSYTGATPPSGGTPFEFPINGKDVAVFFRIIVPEGTTLMFADLNDSLIKVEVVVWLPFVFEAEKDNAEMIFPEDALFSSEGDLFGRKSAGEDNMMTDIVESLSLKIMLKESPFKKGEKLIITSGNIVIINELDDVSFPFIIKEADMKKINDPLNFPFKPNFKLTFSKGDTLNFSKDFKATDIIFTAKIKYKIDL